MPKNSSTEVLRRWRDLDASLRYGGILIPSFARRWHVSTKTIRRDLDAFRALGQRIKGTHDREISEYYWSYEPGVVPLFTCNLDYRTSTLGPGRGAAVWEDLAVKGDRDGDGQEADGG
jgi:hypothetical protein